jgi:hypothetical protein
VVSDGSSARTQTLSLLAVSPLTSGDGFRADGLGLRVRLWHLVVAGPDDLADDE